MISKYCVKKPFTVVVGVIMVLVLGFISFTHMTTDLLPSISLPYVIAITTYPGASPEKVESSVTELLEGSLGTVNGVENVTSTSSENYSMVVLEFEDDTNMDSAMVKLSTAVEQLKEGLPEGAGTPMLMEISPDMMATMTMSVDMDGYDIKELSQFTKDTIIPYLERQSGVASVGTAGLIEDMVEVRLNQQKIDDLNDKLLAQVDEKFAEAKQTMEEKEAELASAKAQLQNGKSQLESQQDATFEQLAQFSQMMDEAVAQSAAYGAQVTNLQTGKAALEAEKKIYEEQGKLVYDAINKALSELIGMAPGFGVELPPDLSVDTILADDTQGLYNQVNAVLQSVIQHPEILAQHPELGSLLEGFTWDNLKLLAEKVFIRLPQVNAELANLEVELMAAEAVKAQVDQAVEQAKANYVQVEKGKLQAAAAFGSYGARLSAGEAQLTSGEAQLKAAKEQYEEARKTALESANLDSMLTMDMLSSLIYAQNFSMPAGYIAQSEDENAEQYLLKIGQEFSSLDELTQTLLVSMDGIGDVRLGDVADVTLIDNAGENYAKMNGNEAVVLNISKSSTAGTSEVSKAVGKAIEELEKQHEGLHITALMDQGDYIKIIVNSVLSNLIWGALLAIIVLVLFLKDPKPTIVVAFSIPLSVLFAVVLMYFSNITLNIISLSGLALGVGMLVDNSIVVIENIYRLRSEGVPAAKAAVRGARQVAGAIIASTLTTVCVFLPIVFTDGLTRQLFQDMGLTIAYSLGASLIVALTVVPSMSATILKNAKEKEHRWFDAALNGYEKILRFCLRYKPVPLLLAVSLLVFAGWRTTKMGMELLPEMNSQSISVTLTAEEGLTKEEAFAMADQAMERLQKIDGVDTVGALTNGSGIGMSASMMSGGSQGNENYTDYLFYLLLTEDGAKEADRIEKAVYEKTEDLPCETEVSTQSMDMSALGGSGVQLDISGKDLDQLLAISEDMKKLLGKVEGIDNISNGQEEGEQGIQLVLDKDAAMRYGLTVAQVYGDMASALTTEKDAVSLTLDGKEYAVKIVDENHKLNVDHLMDFAFDTTTRDEQGNEVKETHYLKEFASTKEANSIAGISRENLTRYISVTSETKEGYNTTLISREVKKLLEEYEVPEGYTIEIAGEAQSIEDSMIDLVQMIALAIVFIYLIMVAQFQSVLSPFIVLFTIPLAFTGGLLGLLITGQKLSVVGMMGFLVLTGVVVNNGIVFVDYVNQLRLAGWEKREALVESGKTRMRPILMTAMTTILAMSVMAFSHDVGSEMGRGMAIVTIGGLVYATLMTLFIVPVLYDLLFRRELKVIDVGEEEREEEDEE